MLCLYIGFGGYGDRVPVSAAGMSLPSSSAKPMGKPVHFRGFTFTQDGLHNCGTIAMLISWANIHPQQAESLVKKQQDGSYLVSFKETDTVRVTKNDLAAASKARILHVKQGDEWAEIVLTAFTRKKCGSGPLNFRVTDWIYPGEIGNCLTGGELKNFIIKNGSLDANSRIQVGPPVSSSILKATLKSLKGKPAVAYTNRLIHIWAIMDYDAARSKILLRNPRRKSSEWMSVADFGQRFQIITYAEG